MKHDAGALGRSSVADAGKLIKLEGKMDGGAKSSGKNMMGFAITLRLGRQIIFHKDNEYI